MAAFDLRSASLQLSQYIETSSSYQNTKTLVHFYDPMVVIVPPNKLAPDGMVGVSQLVDRFYASVKKVMFLRTKIVMLSLFIFCVSPISGMGMPYMVVLCTLHLFK